MNKVNTEKIAERLYSYIESDLASRGGVYSIPSWKRAAKETREIYCEAAVKVIEPLLRDYQAALDSITESSVTLAEQREHWKELALLLCPFLEHFRYDQILSALSAKQRERIVKLKQQLEI